MLKSYITHVAAFVAYIISLSDIYGPKVTYIRNMSL